MADQAFVHGITARALVGGAVVVVFIDYGMYHDGLLLYRDDRICWDGNPIVYG